MRKIQVAYKSFTDEDLAIVAFPDEYSEADIDKAFADAENSVHKRELNGEDIDYPLDEVLLYLEVNYDAHREFFKYTKYSSFL